MFEILAEQLARMTWPVERLRAEREAALRSLVAHAKAQSAWHRRRLANVAVDRLRENDLTTLPVMTKDDLMGHFDEIVTDPRLHRDVVEAHLDRLTTDAYLFDEYHVCASGGSSGRRGVFVYDFEAWAVAFASVFRFSTRMVEQVLGAGPPPMSRAMVAANKASHMTSAMSQTFALPVGESRSFPATLPLGEIVAGLNAMQPEMIVVYASLLHQLAREAAAGRLRVAPRVISSTSEPLLPETRAAVAAVWDAPLVNGLGTTEGLMGGSCRANRGIHLSDDLFVIEPVDARGNPVPPGERAAKMYVTNLYNRTQPLIRYELTDEVVVLDEPCPCGVTLLRIDDIQGRTDDEFAYPGGPTVHPLTFRSPLGRERNVVEYQVRQTARGADILVRCDGPVDTAALAATIRRALVDLGLAGAEVAVTRVDELGRQSTGKLRRFLALPAGAR
jgi:phenylacetate-coenzyme A ligase PaaK-like adenylate-forming protein